MLSQSTEDYLKTIYALTKKGHTTISEIAHAKEVAPSSATNMIKKLMELNFVEHDSHKSVKLTETGRKMSLKILRKHRLLESFMVKVLGYNWDEVHEEACALEHYISEKFESRIDDLLGNPEWDPHGDPIPTIDGQLPEFDYHTIKDMEEGSNFRIARITKDDSEFLKYLDKIGIKLNMKGRLEEKQPFGGPIKIISDKKEILIGPEASEYILGEKI